MEPTGPLSSFVCSQGNERLCSEPLPAPLAPPKSINPLQERHGKAPPGPGCQPKPSGHPQTQHQQKTLLSGVHRRGQTQVAQADQPKHIQGLKSCSHHGTGHAGGEQHLSSVVTSAPLGGSLRRRQPRRPGLLPTTACSHHELAQVVLPRRRDGSGRLGTAERGCFVTG